MSERAAASRSEGRRCGEKIRDERHACEQVEQCKRLSDPSVSNKGFELNAHQITQEIGLISTIIDREKSTESVVL